MRILSSSVGAVVSVGGGGGDGVVVDVSSEDIVSSAASFTVLMIKRVSYKNVKTRAARSEATSI